jgi:hypothetical protein
MTGLDEKHRLSTAEAWQAYNAMEATKQRHFELMTALETKKKRTNLEPTPEELAMLATMLDEHDRQVRTFTAAAGRLKQRDPTAHAALFEYIGKINTLLHRFRVQDLH